MQRNSNFQYILTIFSFVVLLYLSELYWQNSPNVTEQKMGNCDKDLVVDQLQPYHYTEIQVRQCYNFIACLFFEIFIYFFEKIYLIPIIFCL